MSQSFVTSARSNGSSKKSTCRKCNRTIFVVKNSEGALLELDTDLMNVVVGQVAANGEMVFARRVHGELCARYVVENDKAEYRRTMKLSKLAK